MKENWYLSKPTGLFENLGEEHSIKTKRTLIEFQVEYDPDVQLYFGKCNEYHFGVHAKTIEELRKNLEETYFITTVEMLREERKIDT